MVRHKLAEQTLTKLDKSLARSRPNTHLNADLSKPGVQATLNNGKQILFMRARMRLDATVNPPCRAVRRLLKSCRILVGCWHDVVQGHHDVSTWWEGEEGRGYESGTIQMICSKCACLTKMPINRRVHWIRQNDQVNPPSLF